MNSSAFSDRKFQFCRYLGNFTSLFHLGLKLLCMSSVACPMGGVSRNAQSDDLPVIRMGDGSIVADAWLC